MIRIGVIGTIGVGKSTFIERLSHAFSDKDIDNKTFGEPSIIHGNLNEILRKFYLDTKRWAYPLQLGVSAAHEAIYTEIEEIEPKADQCQVAIVDAPYSSFIYCNIHAKAGRLTEQERKAIDDVSRPFHFDFIILLEETADETIARIKKRSRNEEKLDDLSYMYEHIEDFKLFRHQYLDKYFPNSEYIHLESMPNIYSRDYENIIENIVTKAIAKIKNTTE